jgi:hypothetical protein
LLLSHRIERMMKLPFYVLLLLCFLVTVNLAQADSLFAVTLDGRHGFIDRTGKIIIKPDFVQCSGQARFVDGLAVACTKESDKAGFIDKTGIFVIEQKFSDARNFSEGLAAVYLGEFRMHRGFDKAGFIDKTGKILVEPIYDDVKDFSEGLAAVRKNGRSGFVDKTGKIVIPLQFDYAFSFAEGLAAVFVNGKYGFIDHTGKIVIEPQFTDANRFSENFAVVKIGGTTILPYPYSTYQERETIGKIETKYGFINKKGQIVYSFSASRADSFSNGLAAVETLDGIGFINEKGEFAIQPKFSGIFGQTPHFSEGLSLIGLKGNKIGFIDKTGKVVIKIDYEYADDFENGLAQVCEQVINTCGYIDKTGKVIWPPTK